MASESVTDRPASGFEVTASSSTDVSVQLWGDLGLGWFGRLATALARRGVSINSAQATRASHDHWTGTLELLTAKATVDPHTLDYLALSREAATARDVEPRFERARVERTSTGTIEMRFAATDQIGLLSGLLDRLEFLGLFPERLRVTTVGDRVEDTLWLRGVAGSAPSPQAEDALKELMARLTNGTGGS